MASKEEYAVWAKRFASSFGLVWEDSHEMLGNWFTLLQKYSSKELDAATSIMLRQPRVYRGSQELRAGLLEALRSSEAVSKGSGGGEDGFGECVKCSNQGWMSVPHPRCMVSGRWMPYKSCGTLYYPLSTVLCSCLIGRRIGGRLTKPAMTISQYEREFPDWRSVREERERERREEMRLDAMDRYCGFSVNFNSQLSGRKGSS